LCLCGTFHVGPTHSLLSLITLTHLHPFVLLGKQKGEGE